jgi:hypothetical protein
MASMRVEQAVAGAGRARSPPLAAFLLAVSLLAAFLRAAFLLASPLLAATDALPPAASNPSAARSSVAPVLVALVLVALVLVAPELVAPEFVAARDCCAAPVMHVAATSIHARCRKMGVVERGVRRICGALWIRGGSAALAPPAQPFH